MEKRMNRSIVFAAALAIVACGKTERIDADNTQRNENDDKAGALTPGDQGDSQPDRLITQQVRKGVMDNEALGMTAKNVKIITQDGVVTLRGPVNNEKEKTDIGAIAQRVDGVKRVDNQLEVKMN
jgi:osmotically-inducible protein OsmY